MIEKVYWISELQIVLNQLMGGHMAAGYEFALYPYLYTPTPQVVNGSTLPILNPDFFLPILGLSQ
ncbi:hypothetical protein [Nitrososphaera sp. AFS]|uniref:hypothetical protein n=1 Tax=Nitrososphaera sp. AFS TaxID=2301191 RepID=UPI0013922AA1|nr:hypothetical protein [Nitrososphaera sp. AFS]